MTTTSPSTGGRRPVSDSSAGADWQQTDADATVDIRILGPLDVVVQGRSVALSGPRSHRLLALLAVNCDEIVPFDRIVDVLWDDPPSSARQQVHNVVGSLRRALEAAGPRIEVVTSNVGYRLGVPRPAVDAFRFQARVQQADKAEAQGAVDETIRLLREALQEWRGPALSGLPSRQLANAATVLNDQRLAAVERLAELHLRRGDPAASVADLLALVEEFPFRESLRAVLMRTLHQSGRQVDALAVFEEGRRLLAEELGLDPGSLLQAAHQQVLTGGLGTAADPGAVQPAAELQPDPATAPAVAGPAARPGPEPVRPERKFLPRDIVEFTGRDNELRQLVADAGQAGTTALVISAINGMGGVGKTTLAVHLAHRLADDYPGGQYFVDLQGFSAGAEPLAPTQALNLLLRNSGVPPELIPMDLESRSALWRSQLAGQRVLLLLDNAVDAAQVRPLLPGTPGTLVLISSRRRMTSLEGTMPLPLDIMPEADATALFRTIIGADRADAEPEAVHTAIGLCGRLPLAIQIAAARLRDRPNWLVAHVVEQLRNQKSRSRFLAVGDRDVMGVLAWSYRHLTEHQQILFRLLSLHPGPTFDAYAAAALAGITLDEAASGLEELFEVNLLQQHAPGRYRFHDLVRDSAQEALEQHGDQAEREAATRRVLDYYLRSASLWCKQIARSSSRFEPDVTHEPGFVKPAGSSGDAVELLEAEYRNLSAAIRLAVETGSNAHAWQLTCSLLPYFSLLNYGAEVEELCRQALHCARAQGSTAGESVCLMGIATAKRARGLNAEARELALQAVELTQRDGDLQRELLQRTVLGVTYLDDNLYDDAFSCFSSALELACEVGDRQAEADLANNLGVISRGLGKLDEAQQYFRRTLALDANLGIPESQVRTMCNIAQILFLQGRHDEAAVEFDDALRMSRTVHTLHGEALSLTGLCGVRRKTRDFRASLAHGRAALETTRVAGAYDMEGDALNALADTYLSLGDLETAEQVLDQARILGAEHDSPRYAARADEGQAHIAAARGDFEAAEEYWRRSLAVYPGGVVDAVAARRHLASRGAGGDTCWRCVLV